MSFASTPLGQGRRVDHRTFLNKAAPNNAHATAISYRPQTLRQNISNPPSYAYGAPTAASNSPPKPERSATAQSEEHVSDSEQPALVRFARLKQLEQAQGRQQDLGPRVLNTSPNPSKWAVKDTSVNIASAFHQAASSIIPAYDTSTSSNGSSKPNTTSTSVIMNPNDSWASSAPRRPLPRSTSAEYEQSTQAANRRLAIPPARSNLARPPTRISRAPSIRHIPDSEGEDEAATANTTTRGKSPFEHVMDVSRRLAPTTFFLRRQSEEPEARNAPPQDQSSSYDYSAEEREFQASLQDKNTNVDPQPRTNAARKRGRISVDNKAYKPSESEGSDEEFEADGKRKRRKAKKVGAAGGLLTSLPVLGYDKKKKGRRGMKENGAEDDVGSGEEDDQVEEVHAAEQRGARATTPTTPVARVPSVITASVLPSSRHSASRGSVPPESRYDISSHNDTMDVEAGLLESIPEMDEPSLETEEEGDDSTEILSQRSFSVGATLGRGVHWFASLFSAFTHAMWASVLYLPLFIFRSLGLLFDLVVFKPLQLIGGINLAPLYRLVPYVLAALGIYAAWFAASSGHLSDLIPSRSASAPIYTPPATTPPADIADLSERLFRLESALSSLSLDTARTRTYIEGDAREQARIAGRVSELESLVEKEKSDKRDLETKLRASTNQGIQAVQQEVASLHALIDEQRRNEQQRGEPALDKEARAKLQALEERMNSAEGGVKEALELGKQAKIEDAVGDVPTWLKNAASGKTAVTIKSTDGRDVSGLIDHLVQSAIKKASRDTIGRPDFAMYSSGGSIIPSLTSETYEIKPRGVTNQILGWFTGTSSAVGRPPVTALHHETHNGHCWPFPGSEGQLGVLLAYPTRITDVTIDHVAKEVATSDLGSAPRHMELWGLVEGADNVAKFTYWQEQQTARREQARVEAELLGETYVEDEEAYPDTLPAASPFMRLAQFTYDAQSPDEVQTFALPQEIKDLEMDFGIVALRIKSNWGREEFTCLYRFRVHGEPLKHAIFG